MGNQYTWRNKRADSDFVTARLDRILASTSWLSEFDAAVVSHLAVQNSDHCPLLLSIPKVVGVSKKKKLFRFEAMWTKDDQCKGVIEQAWGMEGLGGSPMYRVMEKLKGCRASLVAWSRDRFGSLAVAIKAKRSLLQHLLNSTPSDLLGGGWS
ncbi:putative ribonuclease h protein [Fagus crenata]